MSITIKNVTKSFGTFVALNDVSLEVPAGHLGEEVDLGQGVFDCHRVLPG